MFAPKNIDLRGKVMEPTHVPICDWQELSSLNALWEAVGNHNKDVFWFHLPVIHSLNGLLGHLHLYTQDLFFFILLLRYSWCTLSYKCQVYNIVEKAMAPHSSTLAWKIPWMEEPGRLQSMGLLESHMTEWFHFHFSLSCIGEGNGNPLLCSCLENPRDGGAWWASVYGITQSQTRLKWLSKIIYLNFHLLTFRIISDVVVF